MRIIVAAQDVINTEREGSTRIAIVGYFFGTSDRVNSQILYFAQRVIWFEITFNIFSRFGVQLLPIHFRRF